MSDEKTWRLAPQPQHMILHRGSFTIADKQYLQLPAEDPQALLLAAHQCRLPYAITASPVAPRDQVGLVMRLDESLSLPEQGYHLFIRPDGIEIVAGDAAGAFYGACTLAQFIRQVDGILPCVAIEDWPDFPVRGVMLDISRDKVPTMETLFHLIDLLASWKINQFQLYTEHTFAYSAHPVVWRHASPITAEEILVLDAYCRERFVELVPNQNSFGHMDRWLCHPEYAPLAEKPDGMELEWGHIGPFTLNPLDPRSITLMAGLYDELLPHFSSHLFNVGCDETFDLGLGRSKATCEEQGTERVYLDYLRKIDELVHAHGRTMMFWGDIIMHAPELIPDLPQDAIALEWGYEADHPFARHGRLFRNGGIPFYVCPGTSNWNSLAGRTDNTIDNLTNAAAMDCAMALSGFLTPVGGISVIGIRCRLAISAGWPAPV